MFYAGIITIFPLYGVPLTVFVQGRIQAFAKGAGGVPFPSCPISSPFPISLIPFPLKSRALKPARESGNAIIFPSSVRSGAPAENEFGALKAVRKPLVAIILNIMGTIFYSRTTKI